MSTLLETRNVKSTRNPWQCDGCGRRFDAGTSKQRQRLIGEDGPYTWESCRTCTAISNHLWSLPGWDSYEGVTSDDIYEDMMQRFGSWEEADKQLAGGSHV